MAGVRGVFNFLLDVTKGSTVLCHKAGPTVQLVQALT